MKKTSPIFTLRVKRKNLEFVNPLPCIPNDFGFMSFKYKEYVTYFETLSKLTLINR